MRMHMLDMRIRSDGGWCVKQRLTITVDAEVLPAAKRYARSRSVSLSSLVEQSLREMAADRSASFTERWAGKFAPAGRQGDPRYEYLARKYDL